MASTAAFCSPGSGWAASLKTRWASGLERLAGRAEVVGVAGAPAAAVVAPGTKVCAGPPSEPDPHPAASRASAATATAPLVDLRIEFLSWSSGQLAAGRHGQAPRRQQLGAPRLGRGGQLLQSGV